MNAAKRIYDSFTIQLIYKDRTRVYACACSCRLTCATLTLTHAHTDDDGDGVRFVYFQALMAPACHENMVKVGGYILGEFGNLIAGDARSS